MLSLLEFIYSTMRMPRWQIGWNVSHNVSTLEIIFPSNSPNLKNWGVLIFFVIQWFVLITHVTIHLQFFCCTYFHVYYLKDSGYLGDPAAAVQPPTEHLNCSFPICFISSRTSGCLKTQTFASPSSWHTQTRVSAHRWWSCHDRSFMHSLLKPTRLNCLLVKHSSMAWL